MTCRHGSHIPGSNGAKTYRMTFEPHLDINTAFKNISQEYGWPSLRIVAINSCVCTPKSNAVNRRLSDFAIGCLLIGDRRHIQPTFGTAHYIRPPPSAKFYYTSCNTSDETCTVRQEWFSHAKTSSEGKSWINEPKQLNRRVVGFWMQTTIGNEIASA